jgi:hypothetical protein
LQLPKNLGELNPSDPIHWQIPTLMAMGKRDSKGMAGFANHSPSLRLWGKFVDHYI